MCGRWRPRDSPVLIELLMSGETLRVTATVWTVQNRLRLKESGAIECIIAVVDQSEKV